jgi:hypothetical protein
MLLCGGVAVLNPLLLLIGSMTQTPTDNCNIPDGKV